MEDGQWMDGYLPGPEPGFKAARHKKSWFNTGRGINNSSHPLSQCCIG